MTTVRSGFFARAPSRLPFGPPRRRERAGRDGSRRGARSAVPRAPRASPQPARRGRVSAASPPRTSRRRARPAATTPRTTSTVSTGYIDHSLAPPARRWRCGARVDSAIARTPAWSAASGESGTGGRLRRPHVPRPMLRALAFLARGWACAAGGDSAKAQSPESRVRPTRGRRSPALPGGSRPARDARGRSGPAPPGLPAPKPPLQS